MRGSPHLHAIRIVPVYLRRDWSCGVQTLGQHSCMQVRAARSRPRR
jgi:hypothetical protein